MKLYATVTSERASKGQGGNDYLVADFTINKISIGKVGIKIHNRYAYIISTVKDNTREEVIEETKGKKQKGETQLLNKSLDTLYDLEDKTLYENKNVSGAIDLLRKEL